MSRQKRFIMAAMRMESFPRGSLAVVVGATGGIGAALCDLLAGSDTFTTPIGLSRTSRPALDLGDEASISRCAARVAALGAPRLIVIATGRLQDETMAPEKSWRQLDGASMARAFAINAIGPALVMKHFLPLLPASGKSVFAVLSARVGSVGDNRLGGWYSYRSSKAAVNQLVRTASVELRRRQPEAICVALHPGTVDTPLSAPFRKAGLEVQSPGIAAERLIDVVDRLEARDSGGFFDQNGEPVPW